MSDTSFVRQEMLGEKAPPPSTIGVAGWMRENLFSGVSNSVLTVLSVVFIAFVLWGLIPWATLSVWNAGSLAECREIMLATWGSDHGHACWAVIKERWYQLLFGFYPNDQVWRPMVAFVLLLVALMPVLFSERFPRWLLIVTAAFPFAMPWLMWGGAFWVPLLVVAGLVAGYIAWRVLSPVGGTLVALPVAVLVAVGWWLFAITPLSNTINKAVASPKLERHATELQLQLDALTPEVEALEARLDELNASSAENEALRVELLETVNARRKSLSEGGMSEPEVRGDAEFAAALQNFLDQSQVVSDLRDETLALSKEKIGKTQALSAAGVLLRRIGDLPEAEASLPELRERRDSAKDAIPRRLRGIGSVQEIEARELDVSNDELAALEAYWNAESALFNANNLIERTYAEVGRVGLEPIKSRDFGGFMLSIMIGVVAIGCSLPVGIVLALGRQSDLLIVKAICVGFIEFIRGVPLITLLFVASTLLNIFMPPGTNFDIIVRVMIMVTLFSAAYMAEVIRGGLAALPKGQYEGADSLGLDYWQAQRLIIMPQALKISIPGIVSNFIGIFKDTVLVSIIGLLDPLGVAQTTRANSEWQGIYWELFAFIGLMFFIFCFGMSRYSMYLERKLQTDHR